MLIKYVYVVFMGVLLATFIGVGISTFYKGPKSPDYPNELNYQTKPTETQESSMSAKNIALQKDYDAQMKSYNKANEIYNRNVSIIATIASIIMLTLSLTFFKKILIIADGLLLGGVITLAYAVVRGFFSNDDIFRFAVVSVGLIITLVLGYLKFVIGASKK